ncbi:hypothetical protein IYO1511_c18640 [Lactiplantibacillus plantarum]|nr:hypothetical protein IYO1511_c18640 [Lactiplantibacillus plantarum]
MAVQPDAITVRGGQYQLIATSPMGKVLVRGQLKSATEKQYLTQFTHRTIWHVQGKSAPSHLLPTRGSLMRLGIIAVKASPAK